MNEEERADDPKELALEVLSLRAAEADVLDLPLNLDGDARRGEGGERRIEFPLGEMLNFFSNKTYELCTELGPHYKPSMEESIRAAVDDLKVTAAFLGKLVESHDLPAIHQEALQWQADRIGVVAEALLTELGSLPEDLRDSVEPVFRRLKPGEEEGNGD